MENKGIFLREQFGKGDEHEARQTRSPKATTHLDFIRGSNPCSALIMGK